MANQPRVVIVGGGFGGLQTALSLRRAPVEITLIDKRNFHLFQPLLYQVATGGLSPGDIASPLRGVLRRQKNATVLLGEVVDIDTTSRSVALADGERLPYDILVLATGVSHDYFGHREWAALAPGLKTVEDAVDIRTKIFRAYESAEREVDPVRRAELMTFVVVGGGPTGVELAGALGEIARETLKRDFRRIHSADARIFLVEGADRVLASYPPSLSRKAEESLNHLGVTVLTRRMVTGIDDSGVTVTVENTEGRLDAGTVLWAAGVRGSKLGALLAAGDASLLDRAGRVKVGSDLSLPGHPEVFVIGDLALYTHQGGQPLPGVAPVAMQQGRYVAKVIERRIGGKDQAKPFRYRNYGMMATIGRAAAVADFGKVRISGYPAWLAWLFIHLMKLVEFESRVLVFVQWAWSYFTRNRGARLITGEHRIDDSK